MIFPVVFNLANLNGKNGFTITGINSGDQIGMSVAESGDVNDDGINDIIIGAPNVNSGAGEAYVLFGRKTYSSVISVSSLNGHNGFVIAGLSQPIGFGSVVAGGGDVNGDGIDDFVIGAPMGKNYKLEAYVIYGAKNFSASFNVVSLNGSNGFVISGDAFGSNCFDSQQISVAFAGDVNADGKDDIIFGNNHWGDRNPNDDDPFLTKPGGEAYVIFGTGNQIASFDISNLNGLNGFKIFVNGRYIGASVNGLGDINGDGLDDLIVGDTSYTCDWIQDDPVVPAQAYIVYGSKNGFSWCCNFDGKDGFIISNAGETETLFVSGLGDINNDGKNDIGIMVGSWNIIFGNQTFPVNMSFNPIANYGANSILDGSGSGYMIDGIGDINLDGIDDFIVGSPSSNYGYASVIFGNKAGYPPQFNVARLDGVNGFNLNATMPNDNTGFAVAGLGDVNGDGISDFAVSAPKATIGGQKNVGCVYIMFGGGSTDIHEELLGEESSSFQDNV